MIKAYIKYLYWLNLNFNKKEENVSFKLLRKHKWRDDTSNRLQLL